MKLTKSKLQQIIREEINNLPEGIFGDIFGGGEKEPPKPVTRTIPAAERGRQKTGSKWEQVFEEALR